jgi:azurin
MKNITGILCLGIMISFMSCNSGSESTSGNNQLEIPDDTTTALITEEPDTTLQPIIEVALKAVGNSLDDMTFDQDTLEVTASALVKLKLVNEGTEQSMIHNVVITEPDKYKLVALAGAKVGAPGNYVPESKSVIAASPLALPGQTVEMEFTAPAKPGTYNYVCTYPGHWKKMNGVLLVK